MKPYGSSSGPHKGMGAQRSGHPNVKNMAPGPSTRVITQNVSAKMPPSKGSWSHGVQSGSTSPMADSGGGMGNDCTAHHRSIIGK